MKHIIVGTAGHIDHGKTTLIKALTGRNTDTLAEERARGISINPGYTYFDLPNGNRVGIVDVPGHERFIKNMMAGAYGIDVVMLVIAADSGIMPQTVEHIDILTYMNIRHGIVVVTKSDMVDNERLQTVQEEIRTGLADTFLANAPILCVDSVSGRGLDELISLLQQTVKDSAEKNTTLPARMNIDRVFTLKGLGTVVTGTLSEGIIRRDDTLQLLPGEETVKIRGIQVHGEDRDTASAGQRTALNLSGVNADAVKRGDVLCAPDSVGASQMIDVRLQMVGRYDKPLTHWQRVRLFHGTREILCRAVPLNVKELPAGETGYVQLRLEEPLYCKPMDPFVIRRFSPVETIGGGLIIETQSKKHRHADEAVLAALRIRELGELEEVIAHFVERAGEDFVTTEDVVAYTGEAAETVRKKLNDLIAAGRIRACGRTLLSPDTVRALGTRVEQTLRYFYEQNPLKPGMGKEELKAKAFPKLPKRDTDELLYLLGQDERLIIASDFIALRDHEVTLNPKQRAVRDELLQKIEATTLEKFVTFQDLCGRDKLRKELLGSLTGKEAEKLTSDFYVSRPVYEAAERALRTYFETHDTIDAKTYRDLLGIGRRNAIVLLESFDERRITIRRGNDRILR